MLPQLVLLALATFVSEDLTCIAAGVLVAQGKLGFAEASLACLAGIFVGDLLLFLAGRFAGHAGLSHWPLRTLVSRESFQRAAEWLDRKGLAVVLVSRFTPGLRLPAYFAAGVMTTRTTVFAAYLLFAALLWTPLLVGTASLLGGELLKRVFTTLSETLLAFAVVCALIGGALRIAQPIFGYERRRRIIGFWRRKVQWEFWPAWLAYLPVVPYLVYLMIRRRSVTLFTAANPGMPAGGFVGESKSEILRHLRTTADAVADYAVIPSGLCSRQRIDRALSFIDEYPVVLKPDVGERGSGVSIVRTPEELEEYLSVNSASTIIQRYVEGTEYGVFYYRHPHEANGRILSITEKRFPVVTGDGRSTLSELILSDERAVCLARKYAEAAKRPLHDVPANGERVQLVELGSHCRGAIFLDATYLKTPELEAAIDRISRQHPGFFFGRFDLRATSAEGFQQGREFRVIELNGVSAEATHIYDPRVSIWEAYRVLFQQWRIAFEIGAANRDRGFEPMAFSEFVSLILGRTLNWLPFRSGVSDAVTHDGSANLVRHS